MADISLVIDVKQNGVTSAVKNTKALERNVKLLSDSFKGGGLSQRQYYKGLLELARASGKSESELRKYANELRRAERASAAAAAQARLEAQARRDAAAAARVAAAAQRAATQAAAEAARETKRLADRQLELRMRFQEGYAQFTRQREAMRSLREAYRSGIITLQQYEAQLARIRTANQGNVRGTNNLGVAMQQTGYQVGDFMVQIQGGTNPMVAFGQQATQLVGVLYLLPPATLAASTSIMGLSVSVGFLVMSLGIIIPIATAIGAYFMRMSGSAKKLSDNLNELTSSSDKLKQTFEIIEDKELDQKFGNLTDEVRSLSSAMLTLDSNAQLKNLTAFLDKAESAASAGPFTRLYEGLTTAPFNDPTTIMANTIAAFTTGAAVVDEKEFAKLGFGIGRDQYLEYIKGLKAAANQGNREEVVRLFSELIEGAGSDLTTSGYQLADGYRQAAIDLAEVGALMDGSAEHAIRLAEAQERFFKFEGTRIALEEELAMAQEIAKFGEDSNQVAKLALEQRIAAFDRNINQLVAAGDLEGFRGQILKDTNAELARTESSYETIEEKIKRISSEIEAATQFKLQDVFDAASRAIDGMNSRLSVTLGRMGSIMSSISAIGMDTIGIRAESAALAAGASVSQAGVEATIARDIAVLTGGGTAEDLSLTDSALIIAKRAALEQQAAAADKLKAQLDARRDAEKKGPTSETGQEALDKLVRQAENRRRLVDLTEEQARYEELLFKIQETNATKRDPLSQKELEAAAKKIYLLDEQTRVLEEQNKVQEALASIVESSMENAFMSMVDGTKSVKDAFKSMAAEIIKELYRILVVKRITGMVVGGFGGMTNAAFGGMTNAAVGGGSVGMTAAPAVNPMAGMSGAEMLPQAMGGAWMKGVQMFANGGVVDSPTMFGHSGGVGVMGEAGPEAIMPLKRGANGKLGVSVEGGSGSVVVNNNINVTGGSDPAAIRMEVAKLMPQITSATKSAVIDARRRGGQMKAAFG
jgi:phage-related minor tail protein